VSNIIRALEALGRRPMQAGHYAATIDSFVLGREERKAMLDRDHATLNELMGGTKKMVFAIMAADEEA
jgi:hypothetical protein